MKAFHLQLLGTCLRNRMADPCIMYSPEGKYFWSEVYYYLEFTYGRDHATKGDEWDYRTLLYTFERRLSAYHDELTNVELLLLEYVRLRLECGPHS